MMMVERWRVVVLVVVVVVVVVVHFYCGFLFMIPKLGYYGIERMFGYAGNNS